MFLAASPEGCELGCEGGATAGPPGWLQIHVCVSLPWHFNGPADLHLNKQDCGCRRRRARRFNFLFCSRWNWWWQRRSPKSEPRNNWFNTGPRNEWTGSRSYRRRLAEWRGLIKKSVWKDRICWAGPDQSNMGTMDSWRRMCCPHNNVHTAQQKLWKTLISGIFCLLPQRAKDNRGRRT